MAKEKKTVRLDNSTNSPIATSVSKEIYGFSITDNFEEIGLTHNEAVRLVNFFLSDPDFLSSQKFLNQQGEKND